jgi:hypothetical protein
MPKPRKTPATKATTPAASDKVSTAGQKRKLPVAPPLSNNETMPPVKKTKKGIVAPSSSPVPEKELTEAEKAKMIDELLLVMHADVPDLHTRWRKDPKLIALFRVRSRFAICS